ncbi:hypothetical protein [Qipengyuania atrilutea]|uniref:Uncharacterized protein n=1 Tax=Qipengyuania atrilutea TaxID=2744473 RepID=A0A850H1H5_9SPHN|nr:hypothetical protein [Actirhodobacter atriluteus]NVD44447.1 hypothetical protein [Actirhodobacter atriluteus]
MKRLAVVGTGAALLLLAIMAARYADLFPPLDEAESFDRPSAAEFARTRRAFVEVFAGGSEAQLEDLAFARSDSEVLASTRMYTAIGAKCDGRGTYLVRSNKVRTSVLFTAPHRGFDRLTGNLAAQLYDEAGAAGAAWNTAPRRETAECAAFGDLAAEPRHWFTAFALAFAHTHPDARIVQLHGFNRIKRSSGRLQSASVILSDGTEEPGARLLDLSDCLTSAIHPRQVRVFPIDADELGALQNAQGIALREAGFSGFTHIELSLPLRRALLSDDDLRARFGQCFAQ